MAPNKLLNNLSEYQKDLNSRIFDLIIGRVLKRAYLNLDEKGKESMDKIFLSEPKGYPDEEKRRFVKKYIPDFEKLFEDELKKLEEEIKAEIEKQV